MPTKTNLKDPKAQLDSIVESEMQQHTSKVVPLVIQGIKDTHSKVPKLDKYETSRLLTRYMMTLRKNVEKYINEKYFNS